MSEDGETAARLRPAQIFLVVVAVIFGSEVIVMGVLAALPFTLSHAIEALADAVMLTLLIGPTLYFVLFRRIAADNRALLESERALRAARAGIEEQVASRTLELNDALASQSAQNERLAGLADGTQMLQACRDIAEIGNVVAAQLEHQFSGVPGAFYAYRASRDAIERVASWGAAVDALPGTIAADDCWALRRGRLHVGGAAPGRLRCAEGACAGMHTLCLPLAAGGEAIGLIALRPEADPETVSLGGVKQADWQPLLHAFCESVAVAVSNLRLRESLREQALRDQLTGLFNRRFIDETLRIELAQAARRGEPYSVAMIDVDHFKKFNDIYGHEAGDLVLSTLGAHLLRRMRRSDVACRYGGEEFLVLLPGTDGDTAQVVIEGLRRSVEELAVRLDETRQASMTISIGVATSPANGEDADTLLRSADAALYQSKHAGRNCVTRAQSAPIAPTPGARDCRSGRSSESPVGGYSRSCRVPGCKQDQADRNLGNEVEAHQALESCGGEPLS